MGERKLKDSFDIRKRLVHIQRMNKTNSETEMKNNEARAFAIAQIKSVMDAEKESRSASRKAHAEKEAAAALLTGSRDWSN